MATMWQQRVNNVSTDVQAMFKLWTAALQAAISACAKASEWVRNLELTDPLVIKRGNWKSTRNGGFNMF